MQAVKATRNDCRVTYALQRPLPASTVVLFVLYPINASSKPPNSGKQLEQNHNSNICLLPLDFVRVVILTENKFRLL